MKPKNLFRRDTLLSTNYFLVFIIGDILDLKIYVIPINSDFQKIHLVSFLYLNTDSLESLRNNLIEYLTPI